MLEFGYYNPVRLVFGPGAFDEIGDHAKEHGSRALLVTGRMAMRSSGVLDRALDRLGDAGIAVTLFDRVIPNPTDEVVTEGVELAVAEGCDVIVAVGGGSAMDTGKAIAIAATHDVPISEFLKAEDKAEPTEATLPIICATTTSGTSSELTPFAVVTVTESRMKNAIGSDHIFPRVAICDPELTLTCPPGVTAVTGADVFCHAIEGYISNVATPLTDHFAEKAMALVGAWLPSACAEGDNLEHRYNMSLANVFAGYELSKCGATIMHALEHPISAHYPEVAHGAGLVTMLVAYAETFWRHDPAKFARVAELLGAEVAGASLEDAARMAAPAIKGLLRSIDLDIGLSDLGVEREMLPTLADDTLRYMTRGIAKMPCECDRDDLIALLEASY